MFKTIQKIEVKAPLDHLTPEEPYRGIGGCAFRFRPEEKLLLVCARTAINGRTIRDLKYLLRQGIDWHELIRMANHHRVMPLVYHSLRENAIGLIPKGILNQLQSFYIANAKRNLYLTGVLKELIEWLGTQHIYAIPYKGVTLALAGYGNICLRQFGDIDILVHPADYLKTQNLLINHGYRITLELSWECVLVDDTRNICIDVHRSIVPEEFSVRLDFKRLQERLELMPSGAGRMSTFCAEDMLIILCIQAAKDGSEGHPLRLSKICDIAELISMRGDIDWEQVIMKSRRLGCSRILSLGLTVVHELLGAPLPDLIARSSDFPALGTLTNHIYQQLFHEADFSHPARLSSTHFRFMSRERLRDKAYPYFHWVKMHLIPSKKDRAMLSLPESLSFLYFVIRPIRLSRDFGLYTFRILKTMWLSLTDRR